jgi:hypothetical protein
MQREKEKKMFIFLAGEKCCYSLHVFPLTMAVLGTASRWWSCTSLLSCTEELERDYQHGSHDWHAPGQFSSQRALLGIAGFLRYGSETSNWKEERSEWVGPTCSMSRASFNVAAVLDRVGHQRLGLLLLFRLTQLKPFLLSICLWWLSPTQVLCLGDLELSELLPFKSPRCSLSKLTYLQAVLRQLQ